MFCAPRRIEAIPTEMAAPIHPSASSRRPLSRPHRPRPAAQLNNRRRAFKTARLPLAALALAMVVGAHPWAIGIEAGSATIPDPAPIAARSPYRALRQGDPLGSIQASAASPTPGSRAAGRAAIPGRCFRGYEHEHHCSNDERHRLDHDLAPIIDTRLYYRRWSPNVHAGPKARRRRDRVPFGA